MQIVDIWNNAMGQIGQGTHIDNVNEVSFEARTCKRLFEPVLNQCLDSYNWSFARKDEVITKDNLVTTTDADGNTVEIVSLPWRHSYTLPDDVMRVLFLTPLNANSDAERIGYLDEIRFNFRNYADKKVLVTDAEPDFAVHYQAYTDNIALFSPSFIHALEFYLASGLAGTIVKGSIGYQMSLDLLKYAEQFLNRAISLDSQQGANSIEKKVQPASIRARR